MDLNLIKRLILYYHSEVLCQVLATIFLGSGKQIGEGPENRNKTDYRSRKHDIQGKTRKFGIIKYIKETTKGESDNIFQIQNRVVIIRTMINSQQRMGKIVIATREF